MSPNRIIPPDDPKIGRNFQRKPERRTGAQKRKARGMRNGWEIARRGTLRKWGSRR